MKEHFDPFPNLIWNIVLLNRLSVIVVAQLKPKMILIIIFKKIYAAFCAFINFFKKKLVIKIPYLRFQSQIKNLFINIMQNYQRSTQHT